MPFTFTHPLAVVPFRKSNLIFSALVIGSMSPDFLYFIRLISKGNYGHTFEGLFLFSLPAGFAVFYIFQKWLKIPLIHLFPDSQQAKLARFATVFAIEDRLHFLRILLSLLIGAITHIIWDSFTHHHGWAVKNLPFLQTVLVHSSIGDFTLFKFLQYSGHLLGMPALLFLHWRWLRSAPLSPSGWTPRFPAGRRLAIVVSIFAVSVLLGMLRGYFSIDPLLGVAEFAEFVSTSLVASITTAYVGFLIYAIFSPGYVNTL